MKKTVLFGMLLSTLLIFNNCTKVNSILNTGTVQCKVDGTSWKSISPTTYYGSIAAPVGTTITALATDTKEMIIHLPSLVAIGTYTFTAGNTDLFATWADTPKSKTYTSIDGLVQITEIDADGKISGNFHFTGKDDAGTVTVSITEGTFSKVVKKI